MNARFSLAICELFSPTKHGKTENSSVNIEEQWLVYTCVPLDEFYDNSYQQDILILESNNSQIGRPVELDIIYMDELEQGNELVGYLQTYWLKILQRKWKRIFVERRELIKKRSTIYTLRERQCIGQWSKGLRNWR